MKLAALSKISGDSAYGKEAIAIWLSFSPLARVLEKNNAFELDATEFDMFPAESTATLQYRARAGAYDESAVVPGSRYSLAQKFMGDAIAIDKSDLADADKGLRDLGAHITKKLQRKLRDWAIKVDNAMFNGSGVDDAFKGLAAILNGTTDLVGYTGEKGVIDAEDYSTGDSFDLTTSSNYALFLEVMNELITKVENPNAILLNRKFYGRFTTIARSESGYITTSLDDFGKQVTMFNGIPLEIMHDNSILNTEPDANETPVNNTTSLYIASFGEMNCSFVTNSGFEWNEHAPIDAAGAVKISSGYNWEVRGAFKIENKNSIRRVRHFKI